MRARAGDTGRPASRFDLFYGDFGSLTTGGQITPVWSPDGKRLAFVDGPADERRGWLVDTTTGERSELIDVAAVRAGVGAVTGISPPGRGLPFDRLEFVAPNLLGARLGNHRLVIDLATAEVTGAPIDDPNDLLVADVFGLPQRAARRYRRVVPWGATQAVETASPDGRHWVATKDANIVRRSRSDGRETWWTTDGTPELDWRFDADDPATAGVGWAGSVTNWSPDGTRLAAYRVDSRGVARAAMVHRLGYEDEVEYRYAPRAGGTLERRTLHLLNVHGRPAIQLDLGDSADTYPVFAGWLPDSSKVLVVQLSRDGRRADVLAADAATGAVRRLFTESGDTFVRTSEEVYLGRRTGLWVTPDGRRLLWLSERDGWKHLYAYDLDGRLRCQLTRGSWPVDQVRAVAGGDVYFTAHHDQDRPYDLHLCRVPLDGGEVRRLTHGPGVHRTVFSPDAAVFVDVHSTPARPPVSELRRGDGTALGELSRAETAGLDEVGWTPPRQFTVTAADGETELWGVLHFPADFDPTLSYPLVEYVYGGPQVAAVGHDWAGGFHTRPARALAQLGYVVVQLDGRGTPERSKRFHDAIHRDWAGVLAADHAGAVEQLAGRFGFIDAGRAGVMGHSLGGYAAFRLLADRPDVYRAAVSHAPCYDPYASVLHEYYLGFPQDNRHVYEATDALPLAAKVAGALLIAGGTFDHSTWSDAVKMSEALIRAGKEHEFVPLPGQSHWYDSAHDGYFWRKVTTFFATHLGGPRPAS